MNVRDAPPNQHTSGTVETKVLEAKTRRKAVKEEAPRSRSSPLVDTVGVER